MPLSQVFIIGDAMNGLMALPNVLALFWLMRAGNMEKVGLYKPG